MKKNTGSEGRAADGLQPELTKSSQSDEIRLAAFCFPANRNQTVSPSKQRFLHLSILFLR